MFHLTREVRLSAGSSLPARRGSIQNGHAGFPPLQGPGHFLTVQVSLRGDPAPQSGYLMNIKQIDEAVRTDGLPLIEEYCRRNFLGYGTMTRQLFDRLNNHWPNLDRVQIAFSPYSSWSASALESPMVRFNQKFEFSAAHRLHNPNLDGKTNRELFGKCNNPHGHGHNYELEVSIAGAPDTSGQLIPVDILEDIVIHTVINRFDHKFLNLETAEFAAVNPTVENIAQTIYTMLRSPIAKAGAKLAAVKVWETPKTWCEYSE
jgi:6-pyruvoyltetrahydropterin/6-carboxytetrahydropterin synthase